MRSSLFWIPNICKHMLITLIILLTIIAGHVERLHVVSASQENLYGGSCDAVAQFECSLSVEGITYFPKKSAFCL
jgi:hypothetical protein